MRNLKKILALALALVMSMSLMATANAFSDDEDITGTYKTAVDVLAGLEVFQGYENGSFDPKGAITRAEVAAILYRIVTGDVDDTQKDIYADYGLFDDVASTSWYAGYVNFCANAEYIKGYDADTFGPNDPVTGYQALAMILRALGYDKNDEFTGTDWHIQTAAVGEQRKITKNITAGTLQSPATREVVAEILFQAILVETVNYTPAFGYQIGDTSLGEKTFGLKDITGVVVANEYADLYSGTPLKTGKTELVEDGESYIVNHATTVEDLGEARHAYVTGETVLAIADADNTVWTNDGAETDIGSDKDFEDVTALVRDDETEEYINFGGDGDAYESDWRIEYMVSFRTPAAEADFVKNYVDITKFDGYDATRDEITVVIRAGKAISEDDLAAIKGIFAAADDDDLTEDIIGSVYVGTGSGSKAEDVSDTMSYRAFYNEYITEVGDSAEVNGADNGEWLKVVDNDGDGVADYVFRIDFAMSVIERISRDDEYTLADLDNHDEVSFTDVEIDGSEIKTEDELAEGDVVIYTLIDGNYYMSLAEMVTETVDKKGINSKTETMTCDGTDYVQSHIGYGDGDIYYHDVTEAHTEETYDLYLDHFNYVRLFVESDYDTFMLLTDGWYETDNRTENFQAYYWDVEAEEETRIDVTDGGSDFIDDGATGDEETWGNLYGADWTYLVDKKADWQKVYATNIAGYSETADGYALKNVEDSAERMDYTVQAFEVDGLKDESLDAYHTNYDIQTTTDTQYYLVIRSRDNKTVTGWTVDDVITWTGYKNAPAEAKLVDGAVGYAVTHGSKADNARYTVADVVVFETAAYADRDTYFVYAPNNYLDFIDRDRVEHVWGVGYDDEGVIDTENQLLVEKNDDEIVDNGLIQFYEIFDNQTVNFIGSNYASKNIYAGTALTSWDVEGRNYVRVDVEGADDLYIYDDAPVYKVTFDTRDGYDVAELNRDKVDVDDLMILFTDSDENVKYAINVSKSLYEKITIRPVFDLWTDICVDAHNMGTLTFYGVAARNDVYTITVDYATAVKNGGGLDVGNRDILSITSDGRTVDSIPETPAKLPTDVEYIVVTKDKAGVREVWTLTVKAANDDADLLKVADDSDAGNFDIAAAATAGLTVQEFVDLYKLSDKNATIDWTFTTKGGTEFGFTGMTAQNVPYNVTMSEIESVVAKVTAENGVDSKTYKDTNAAQDDADAALDEVKAAAIADLEDAIVSAVQDEAEAEGVTVGTAAQILADNTTSISAAGWGTGYATVKEALAKWTSEINGETTAAGVNTRLTSIINADHPDTLAGAYVSALKSAATQDADDALTAINTALNNASFETAVVNSSAESAFKAAIEDAINALITDTKATVTVTNWGDLNVGTITGDNGNLTVTGVKVRLSYEGASTTMSQDLGTITVPYQL